MAKRCTLISLNGYKKIYLPDNEEVNLGRRILTGIKDSNVSRTQMTVKANYSNDTVSVIHLGRNLSAWNGYVLPRNEECTCGQGDILELLYKNYSYKIVFSTDGNGPILPHFSPMKNEGSRNSSPVTPNWDNSATDRAITDIDGAWEHINGKELLIFTPNNIEPKVNIAAFDVDGTIIETKSGARFPKDFNDWRLAQFGPIKDKLLSAYKDNYKLVFFTNQMGLSRNAGDIPNFKKKIGNILKSLNLPIQVFIATGKSIYRKPCLGMWDALVQCKNGTVDVDISSSFYVGDAAGRPKGIGPKGKKDHSNADRLFALNIGLKFYTPEEYFLGKPASKFEMPEFDPRNLIMSDYPDLAADHQEVVLMVGGPGSGKTSFAKTSLVSHGYTHVNRDSVGSWQKCVQLMESALRDKRSVVIDNTNGKKEERKRYIDVARRMNIPVRSFLMKTTKEHCLHNNKFRSLTDKSHVVVGDPIILSYWKHFEMPTKDEGFSDIIEINFHLQKISDPSKRKLYKSFLLES